jgi:hypothetical protein
MSGRTGLYIYGLMATEANMDTASLGVGIAMAEVRLWRGPTLAALVSGVADEAVAQTRRNLLAHTAVLERAMAHANVLPMRFGTLAPDERALASCLAANAASFHAAIASIHGRVELGVKASWREGVVYAEIIAADTVLARMRDRLMRRPATETYYERVELGRRIEAALEKRRAAETSTILAELSPLAEREAELRTLDADMILNRAFLVPRRSEALFDARMAALAELHAARMQFRYVGPVPPYNFIQLQAGWLAGEKAA